MRKKEALVRRMLEEIHKRLEAVPPGKVAELVGTHRSAARVRAVPFDTIELDLSVLWEE